MRFGLNDYNDVRAVNIIENNLGFSFVFWITVIFVCSFFYVG